jgi:ubiquinone/menaquinone biosynthesis C-methylase UbiE
MEIIDGLLKCDNCSNIFPIIDRLLDLVPPSLLYVPALEVLESRYPAELARIGYRRPALNSDKPDNEFAEQNKQRQHFDDYADGVLQAYDDYARMPFWQAVDGWTFERWQEMIPTGEILLDVGCADGRSSFPHLQRNIVVGFDISRKMIRRAIDRALAEGRQRRFCFFVADASSLPFKSASFGYVQTYGVLHHLPKPGNVIREIQRVLKPGGIHFASENNKTVFRKIFDITMRIMPIWYEEAGEEALISLQMVEAWSRNLPVRFERQTIVFLPPHLFNIFSASRARRLLDLTNRIFGALPALRDNGGLIVFRLHKIGDRDRRTGE